jgi:hypothetical protein
MHTLCFLPGQSVCTLSLPPLFLLCTIRHTECALHTCTRVGVYTWPRITLGPLIPRRPHSRSCLSLVRFIIGYSPQGMRPGNSGYFASSFASCACFWVVLSTCISVFREDLSFNDQTGASHVPWRLGALSDVTRRHR